MGKIYSKLTRPIRTFNIENRVEKIISLNKPIPAPQYASTEKQRKISDQVNPNFLKDHYQKNKQLDQRLKDVFVTSTDPQETKYMSKKESRPLPQDTHSIDDYISSDFSEPIVIPEGKCSLKQALIFIMRHKQDPTKYNSENIANEYKMDKKVVDDILKHFKLFASTVPQNQDALETDQIEEFIITEAEMKKKEELEMKKENK